MIIILCKNSIFAKYAASLNKEKNTLKISKSSHFKRAREIVKEINNRKF